MRVGGGGWVEGSACGSCPLLRLGVISPRIYTGYKGQGTFQPETYSR